MKVKDRDCAAGHHENGKGNGGLHDGIIPHIRRRPPRGDRAFRSVAASLAPWAAALSVRHGGSGDQPVHARPHGAITWLCGAFSNRGTALGTAAGSSRQCSCRALGSKLAGGSGRALTRPLRIICASVGTSAVGASCFQPSPQVPNSDGRKRSPAREFLREGGNRALYFILGSCLGMIKKCADRFSNTERSNGCSGGNGRTVERQLGAQLTDQSNPIP